MQIIIIIILAVSLFSYVIYNQINQKIIQQKNLEKYLLQIRAEIDESLDEYRSEKLREIVDEFSRVRADQENRLNETRRFHEQIIEQLEEKRKIAEEADARDIEQRQKTIEAKVQAYQEVEMQKAANAISDEKDKEILWAEQSLTNYWDCMAQETFEKRQEIEAIQGELEEWRKKRQAINEEIMRFITASHLTNMLKTVQHKIRKMQISICRAVVGGDAHIAPPNICEENIGISVGNHVILPYGNVILLAKSPGRCGERWERCRWQSKRPERVAAVGR